MNIDDRVKQEMDTIRSQFTAHEWYSLSPVVEKLVRRLLNESLVKAELTEHLSRTFGHHTIL